MLDLNHGSDKPENIAGRVNAEIDAAIIAKVAKQPRREYLGASMLGKTCNRAIQYEFVGAPKDNGKDFNGQTLRIFAAGHTFEDLIIGWIQDAGFDLRIRDKNEKQFGFSIAGGKISGHVDGVIVGGHSWLKVPALWECKTANEKSWNDIVKKGVAISKPIYAAQIALYQAYMNLSDNPALFTVINKNTAEIHHELVPFNADLAQRISDNAVAIIKATENGEQMPRGFATEDHFECKFCSYKQRCWK